MTRAPVTVITPTIPGREELLAQCVSSVYAQTFEPEAHLVLAQSCTEGLPSPVHCAHMQNALVPSVTTGWTMRLADDDRLLPHHLARFFNHPFAEHLAADVLYSWDSTGNRPRVDCTGWNQYDLIDALARRNWIDGSAVAIRTERLLRIGGWPTKHEGRPPFDGYFPLKSWRRRRAAWLSMPDSWANPCAITCEDWAAFYALAVDGARFVCIPEPTWEYGAGPWHRISTGH